MMVKIQGGGSGTTANGGSCGSLRDYLEKEQYQQMAQGKPVERFFTQKMSNVSRAEVVDRIDNNRKGLKKTDAKFFAIVVAPSRKELEKMGKTKEEQSLAMKEYIRKEVMPRYAEGFGKDLKEDDLVWYGMIHHERQGKNEEDLHAHIIVSRKTQNCGKQISPMSNHTGNKNTGVVKGGFHRTAFYEGCEKGFDEQFGFERGVKESFEYRNALKSGGVEDIRAQAVRVVAQEQQEKEKKQESAQERSQDKLRPGIKKEARKILDENTNENNQQKTRGFRR